MAENQITDNLFNHFAQDKPTKAGTWLVKNLARKTFKYTEAAAGNSFLEIGPGRGDFAGICLQEGIEYFAIEPNRQMAESLESKGAKVVCAKVPPLPELDKKFDAVVMINVMEHMNSMQDALRTAQQISQILKPKGRLVICSPDYLNWRHNFFNCDFSHNYVTTRRRLEQLLVNVGFSNIKSCYLSGPLTGFMCFLISALVSRLPFGLLNALFPNNKVFYKFYKLQLTFSRVVLICGEKPG